MHQVVVLFDGYSKELESTGKMDANCTCTLIKGPVNIIVDTMTAWDREKIVNALKNHNVNQDDINYVVCTHSHADHIGNNNLFINAEHIVGCCIQNGTIFDDSILKNTGEYKLHDDIKIIATPGHTSEDVSLLVDTAINDENVKLAIVGDLFENEFDISTPLIWKSLGVEELQCIQARNRLRVIKIADYIIPGHGSMFRVTEDMRKMIESQVPV